MNTAQRKIIIGMITLIVIAFLFPPHALITKDMTAELGYNFIGKIPEYHTIHIWLLLAEWFGILVIGFLGLLLTKDRK
ncbi:MAG: hypothetical protein JRI31_12175 [Deltaproteobacteria bacterium]|nr:hypothetical protein [Deltaproteobacteria bacterium]